MSLSIKADVRVFGLRPEILIALIVAEGVYRDAGFDLVLTAGIDGNHAAGSSHYQGEAIDLRTSTIPEDKRAGILAEIIKRLTPDYFAQVEVDHFHIQWKAQKTYTG